MAAKLAEKYASRTGMTLLSVDEHRELFTNAGYSNVQVIEERDKGWICGIGRRPDSQLLTHQPETTTTTESSYRLTRTR